MIYLHPRKEANIMSDKNIKKQHSAQALNDDSLENVAGGYLQAKVLHASILIYAPSKSNKDFAVYELF